MQLEQYQAPSLVQLRSPNAHMCCASLALESRASSVDYLPSTSGTSVSVTSFPPPLCCSQPHQVLRNTLPCGPPTPTTAGVDPVLLCTCFRLPGSVTHTNTTSSTQRTLRSHVLHFSSHLMVPFSIYRRRTV